MADADEKQIDQPGKTRLKKSSISAAWVQPFRQLRSVWITGSRSFRSDAGRVRETEKRAVLASAQTRVRLSAGKWVQRLRVDR